MRSKQPTLTHEREQLILDAAQKRFAVYGLTKVTMDEIASDIGLGKATLYYYFPTKEEVFRRVVQREQEEFLKHVGDIIRSKASASDKLKAYSQRRQRLFTLLINLNLVTSQTWLDFHPILNALFKEFADEEMKMLTRILREGTRRGEFDVPSPEKVATTVLHTLHGLRLRAVRMTQSPAAPGQNFAELEHEVEHLCCLILDGIKKRTNHRKAPTA